MEAKNIIKKIILLLVDVAIWLGFVILYGLKKMKLALSHFAKRENLKKNKFSILICAVIFLAIGYVLWNYTIAFIPKDTKKQTATEKMFLNSLKVVDTRLEQNDFPTRSNTSINSGNSATNMANSSRTVTLKGKIKLIMTEKITILAKTNKEESFVLTDKTKITPSDIPLNIDQQITVYAHSENGSMMADRISISPTASGVGSE